MTRSLFFVDIDGTLLRSGHPVPETVIQAAMRFQEAGGLIALCTGRSPLSTANIAKPLNIHAPCVLCSGAAIYDFTNGTALATSDLPPDVCDRIKALIDYDAEVSVQAYTLNRAYLLQSNAVIRERGIREELEKSISSIDEITGPMLKLVLTHHDPETLRECGAKFFNTQYHFAFASRRFAEIVAVGADKGAAAGMVAKMLDIPIEASFAAGDAGTDIPLLAACGYTFAPCDARQEVLEIVDHIIPSCDEGGIASAFYHALETMAAT